MDALVPGPGLRDRLGGRLRCCEIPTSPGLAFNPQPILLFGPGSTHSLLAADHCRRRGRPAVSNRDVIPSAAMYLLKRCRAQHATPAPWLNPCDLPSLYPCSSCKGSPVTSAADGKVRLAQIQMGSVTKGLGAPRSVTARCRLGVGQLIRCQELERVHDLQAPLRLAGVKEADQALQGGRLPVRQPVQLPTGHPPRHCA